MNRSFLFIVFTLAALSQVAFAQRPKGVTDPGNRTGKPNITITVKGLDGNPSLIIISESETTQTYVRCADGNCADYKPRTGYEGFEKSSQKMKIATLQGIGDVDVVVYKGRKIISRGKTDEAGQFTIELLDTESDNDIVLEILLSSNGYKMTATYDLKQNKK